LAVEPPQHALAVAERVACVVVGREEILVEEQVDGAHAHAVGGDAGGHHGGAQRGEALPTVRRGCQEVGQKDQQHVTCSSHRSRGFHHPCDL
jgi:hypothetical protein